MIYIIGGVLALFLIMSIVIFFYQKRSQSLAKDVKIEREAKEQLNAVIVQKVRQSETVKAVEVNMRNKRKEDQAKIDLGDRSGFQNDEF